MASSGSGKAQLLCALAIVVALGALLAIAPGGPSRASSPTAARPDSLDPEALANLAVRVEPRVARKVEALRDLSFDRIPTPEVVDSDYLNNLSAREAHAAGAYGGLGADEAALRILGALQPDEQLESIFGSTGDLAAAAYDPETKRLYVISDAVAANRALVEFVLSHELTHALEDQRYGLREGNHLDDDASLALTALYEGSATSMMVDYASQNLNPADLIAASVGLDSGTGGVPKFYVDQLTWTYLGGMRFIAALRELAGGWKLVDYAEHTRPPATTEQVLHPVKYVHDEQPLPVTVASDQLRSGGWHRAGRGVIGELTTQQLLELGVDHATARRAAAGWGGDRYELWRRDVPAAGCQPPCRADLALVADWRMDSRSDATQLADALRGYLDHGLRGSSANQALWSLDGGSAALGVRGADVTLSFAPDPRTASLVARDQLYR